MLGGLLFVDRRVPRQHVTLGLLKAAVEYVQFQGAKIVADYSVEPGPRLYTYTGSPKTFVKAGFRDVTLPGRERRIMRYFVRSIPRTKGGFELPMRNPVIHWRAQMRIGSIVVHCHEFERMVTFWQNALHYAPRRPANNGWVVLCDPAGKGPNLSFQLREKRRPGRNWIHLDLYTNRQEEEVNRLLQLGARRYPWRYRAGSDFVVLEDPDGNLFCVVQLPQEDAVSPR